MSTTLATALKERDEALAALAKERALVEALRQALRHAGEAEPVNHPSATTPGEPPLRYRLADQLHQTLGPLVAPGREVLERLLGAKK